jgi:hypothetical protein
LGLLAKNEPLVLFAFENEVKQVSYEYLMQAVLLIFLLIATFAATLAWAKWRTKKRRR